MKQYVLMSIISVSVMIGGCGGGGSVTSPEVLLPITDPEYYRQWHLEYNASFYDENNIDPEAHINASIPIRSYQGEGIKIAIIDDGFDILHPELQGRINETYDLATGTTDVSHETNRANHGTAVAGIIAANANSLGLRGIAPKSELILIKYKPSMSDSETIRLFEKAVEFGADIINCSWGTGDVSFAVKEYLQSLIQTGRNGKGLPIIFASGNQGTFMANDESAIPEVIAVGATNISNRHASYSNFGPFLDVLAPAGDTGLGILALDPVGFSGISQSDYAYFTGTSAAAPIVTGALALALEKNPDIALNTLVQKLHNTADKIGNVVYEDGRNLYYGYGKLNLQNLMSTL